MSEFKDSVVWITGASEGIGRALAVAFAEVGASVVASARNADALAELASEREDAITALPLDVTDGTAITRSAETVLGRFGRVDLLINNAGLTHRALIRETGLDVFRRIMEVNFFGALALTQAVLPSMLERGSGHIALMGSPAGKYATPLRSGYCAAKYAAHGFFESLRSEVAGDGIGVTVIIPGPIRTNVTLNAITGDGGTFGKMEDGIANGISPEDCAKAVLAGLAAGEDEIYVVTPEVDRMLALRRDDPPAYFERVKSMVPR